MIQRVAPYAGAWIETYAAVIAYGRNHVAPYAGAWIETGLQYRASGSGFSRSLRGSVD